ncbi:MAG TPA: hypothetical protein VIU94_44535, partial [Streptomyces sp.]
GGAGAHRLRRTGGGELLLRANRGRDVAVRPGEPAELGDDCALLVQGVRPTGRRTSTGGPSRLLGRLTARGRRGPVPGQRDPRSGWSRPGDGDRHGERHSERTPPHPDEHPAGARTWDPNF